MVLTRSGRNVSGPDAPPAPRTSRARSKDTAAGVEQHERPDVAHTRAQEILSPVRELPPAMRGAAFVDPPADPTGAAAAADHIPQHELKIMEKQVLFSPRAATGGPTTRKAATRSASHTMTPTHYLSAVELPAEDENSAAAGSDSPPCRDQHPASTPSKSPQQQSSKHGSTPRRRFASSPSILLATLAIVTAAAGLLTLCFPPLILTPTLPPSLFDAMRSLSTTSTCTSVNQASTLMQHQAASALRSMQLQIHRIHTQLTPKGVTPLSQTPSSPSQATPAPASSAPPALSHLSQLRLLLQRTTPSLHQQLSDAGAGTGTERSKLLRDAWDAAAELAGEKLKALGVLLVCHSSVECDAAVDRLLSAPASPGGSGAEAGAECVAELSLSGAEASSSGAEVAGWLQQRLATLMSTCCGLHAERCAGASSRGLVVVMRGLDSAPLPALSVLTNVLSESGNLQSSGVSIPMHRASFVFPFHTQRLATEGAAPGTAQEQRAGLSAEAAGSAGGGDGAEEAGESFEAASRRCKDELVARLAAQDSDKVAGSEGQGSGGAPQRPQSVVLMALRRRIDIVLQASAPA